MMDKWKVLSSEYLIRKPWLTARCDRLELPDGRRLLDENAIFRSLMAAPLWRYFAEQERT